MGDELFSPGRILIKKRVADANPTNHRPVSTRQQLAAELGIQSERMKTLFVNEMESKNTGISNCRGG